MSTAVTETTPEPRLDDLFREWKSVNEMIIENQEIPQRKAMHIPVSVPDATFACDICFEKSSQIKELAVELTLNTVREGNQSVAFVLDAAGGLFIRKQGVILSSAPAFNGQVMPEPVELSHARVGAVSHSSANDKSTHYLSLDSRVKVVDYHELKPSLLSLHNKYWDLIALLRESLATIDKT